MIVPVQVNNTVSYRGRLDPVIRHWERAQYRHMCHRSLGRILKNGDRESQ